MAKTYAVENNLADIEEEICQEVVKSCGQALINKYSEREVLGKVYVDEELKNFIVPTSQRNASKALKTVARGSRFKISEEAKVIRAFVYWKEPKGDTTDLDLSAVFYDKDFEMVSEVTFYDLKDEELNCYHSGDIRQAPKGASEYIDIDLKKAKEKEIKYVSVVVNSYSQQPFCDLPECFAGYMERGLRIKG